MLAVNDRHTMHIGLLADRYNNDALNLTFFEKLLKTLGE
jgi:hypothetical protein